MNKLFYTILGTTKKMACKPPSEHSTDTANNEASHLEWTHFSIVFSSRAKRGQRWHPDLAKKSLELIVYV